ncbi:hypothetical protein [Corynebacterium casei]|uniref:hypothetical protein n=1 Tax=Corynebacterium casei TaxID=160386 RepID=UPI0034543C74
MQDCTPDALSLMVWVSLHICDEEAATAVTNYSAHADSLTGFGVIHAYPEAGVVEDGLRSLRSLGRKASAFS